MPDALYRWNELWSARSSGADERATELALELEDWARRRSEPGSTLDIVCSKWMLPKYHVSFTVCGDCGSKTRFDGCPTCDDPSFYAGRQRIDVRHYSSDKAAAMDLLSELLELRIGLSPTHKGPKFGPPEVWTMRGLEPVGNRSRVDGVSLPHLAARTAAVLEARDVKLREV